MPDALNLLAPLKALFKTGTAPEVNGAPATDDFAQLMAGASKEVNLPKGAALAVALALPEVADALPAMIEEGAPVAPPPPPPPAMPVIDLPRAERPVRQARTPERQPRADTGKTLPPGNETADVDASPPPVGETVLPKPQRFMEADAATLAESTQVVVDGDVAAEVATPPPPHANLPSDPVPLPLTTSTEVVAGKPVEVPAPNGGDACAPLPRTTTTEIMGGAPVLEAPMHNDGKAAAPLASSPGEKPNRRAEATLDDPPADPVRAANGDIAPAPTTPKVATEVPLPGPAAKAPRSVEPDAATMPSKRKVVAMPDARPEAAAPPVLHIPTPPLMVVAPVVGVVEKPAGLVGAITSVAPGASVVADMPAPVSATTSTSESTAFTGAITNVTPVIPIEKPPLSSPLSAIDLPPRGAPIAEPVLLRQTAVDDAAAPSLKAPISDAIVAPLPRDLSLPAAGAARDVPVQMVAGAQLRAQPDAPRVTRRATPVEAAPLPDIAPLQTDQLLRARPNTAFAELPEPRGTEAALIAQPAPAAVRQDTPVALQAPVDTTRGDWMRGMIERIETIVDHPGNRETRLTLSPDALGEVSVRLKETADGLVLSLDAATPEARALIAEAAPRLTEMAESRGLRMSMQAGGGDAGGQPAPQRNPAKLTDDSPVQNRHVAKTAAKDRSDERLA